MLCLVGSVVLVGVGVFIGWNVEQPELARKLQDKVLKLVKGDYSPFRIKQPDSELEFHSVSGFSPRSKPLHQNYH